MSGGGVAGILLIVLLVIVLFIAASCVKIVPQASAYVVESLGKYKGTWQPVFILSSVYRARGHPREFKRAGGGFPAAAGYHKR